MNTRLDARECFGHFCALWGCFIHFWRDVLILNLPQPRLRFEADDAHVLARALHDAHRAGAAWDHLPLAALDPPMRARVTQIARARVTLAASP